MNDGWFYAEGGRTIGPLKFTKLRDVLANAPDARRVMIWREGYMDWIEAEKVPELSSFFVKLPPSKKPPLLEDSPISGRARLINLLLTGFAILIFGFISNYLYDNSAAGIGQIFGEALIPFIIALAIAWKASRTYRFGIALIISAVFLLVFNVQKLISLSTVLAGREALKDIRDPAQISKALEKNPSNVFLQLMAKTREASDVTGALSRKLSDEVEPPGLSQDINLPSASRAELESYRRNLQTAQDNAAKAIPRLAEFLKTERSDVESFARSLKTDDEIIRNLIVGLDKRLAANQTFNMKMMLARSELYRALSNSVDVLIENFGTYKIANGQMIFANQSTADRFNVASKWVIEAAERVTALDGERKQLIQSQQDGWERFISGK